jgi:hypothetical protein
MIQAMVEIAVLVPARRNACRARTDRQRGRNALASSKRQTTMAKMTRERKVKEKRELKMEKKAAAAAERARAADPEDQPVDEPSADASID